MIAHLEIGLFLLAAIAAIGVAANRLAPAAVDPARDRRRGPGHDSRPAARRAGARARPAARAATGDLLGRRLHELARIPLQSAPHRAARHRLRGVHDLRGGGGRSLAAWLAVGRRFRPRRHRAPPDVVAPLAIARRLGLPRRLRVILEGEGLANDATALVLYRFAVVAVSTGAFSFSEASGALCADPRRRDRLRHRHRLAHAAPAPRHERHARRDHPIAPHALSRLLGARAVGRLGRARHGRGGPLRELERTAPDLGGNAPAGRLLLGPVDVHRRGPAVPALRPAGAHGLRAVPTASTSSSFSRRPR